MASRLRASSSGAAPDRLTSIVYGSCEQDKPEDRDVGVPIRLFLRFPAPLAPSDSLGRVLFNILAGSLSSRACCSLGGPGVIAASLRRCFSFYGIFHIP